MTVTHHQVEASPVDFDTYGTIYQPRGGARGLPPSGAERYPLRGRITSNGDHEPGSGRYHLYAATACPFAHRALIVRSLKGLEDVISISVVDPLRDGRGWAFRTGPGHTLDTGGSGFAFLSEAYEASVDGAYEGHVSVPLLWDKQSSRGVSNYLHDIVEDLATQFDAWSSRPDLDLFDRGRADEIAELSEYISQRLNVGVYAAGFATGQEGFDSAESAVFEALDSLEARLGVQGPYLFGRQLTDADIRLWVTLVRFDAVYHGHFKLHRRRLADYPNLWLYARRLYALDGFASTTDVDSIRRHYYGTQRHINPSGIVPPGPDVDWSVPTR